MAQRIFNPCHAVTAAAQPSASCDQHESEVLRCLPYKLGENDEDSGNDQKTGRQRPVPVWLGKEIQEVLWRAVASDWRLFSHRHYAGKRRTQAHARTESGDRAMGTGSHIALSLWEHKSVSEVLRQNHQSTPGLIGQRGV